MTEVIRAAAELQAVCQAQGWQAGGARLQAIFVMGHDEIGLESDVVEVVCRP